MTELTTETGFGTRRTKEKDLVTMRIVSTSNAIVEREREIEAVTKNEKL